MKIPQNIQVFGNLDYRGGCPREAAEQITFFNWLRLASPDVYGVIATHIRNEGKRSNGLKHKAEGMTTGAPDIIIPGCPSFCCELKRQNHTKSKLSAEQIRYLETAQKTGAFCCVALGFEGAKEAFLAWSKLLLLALDQH